MDDLNLIREFRAERAADDPRARADAWRALEARFEIASASAPAAAPQARRRGFLSRRRRLFAFAGTTALAAVAAGVIVLSSGPTAETASAEILHRTASVAASSDSPAAIPTSGEFLYRKFKRLELEGWLAPGVDSGNYPAGSMGTPLGGPNAAIAFTALVPTTQESWLGADGAGRTREVAGTPEFLSDAEQSRWEAMGSPLPAPFEQGQGVFDSVHGKWKGFHLPDTSALPTEPDALRHAVEYHQVRGGELGDASTQPLDAERTIAGLFDILVEGTSTTPQLRAAAFNALGEMPGIKVDTDATDFLGRGGDAIRLIDEKAGSGTEFVFDPRTSELLAQREFISDPEKWVRGHLPEGEAETPVWQQLSAGLTIRETAYLDSGLVGSTDETAGPADRG